MLGFLKKNGLNEKRREEALSSLEEDLAASKEKLLTALNSIDPAQIDKGNILDFEIHPPHMGFVAYNSTPDRGSAHTIAWSAFRDIELSRNLSKLIDVTEIQDLKFISQLENEIYEKSIEWAKSVIRESGLMNKGFDIYVSIHDSMDERKV